MPIKIKLKHSATANKAPLPSDLDAGELALNINAASPAAYIKDSTGAIVKLAGAGAAGATDATTSAKGVVRLADAAAITAGTAGRVVDAAQLKAATDADDWTRTGTTLSPKAAGDVVGISAGTAAAPGLTPVGDPNTGINSPGSDQLAISTNGIERARIDASGRLLVGTSVSRGSRHELIAFAAPLQIESEVEAGQALTRWSADISGSRLHLQKGRGTIVAPTSVASGDSLAEITFSGFDGTNMTNGARIEASVDGTPAADNMPGRLVFLTTAHGGSTPTERMRIDSAGNVGIGTTTLGNYKLDVQGGGQRILHQGSPSFLEIGKGTTTSQSAHADLITDTTYADFGLRLVRDGTGGANATSQLINRGTGELRLTTLDAGSVCFVTKNTERARVDPNGKLLVGTSTNASVGSPTGANLQVFAAPGQINAAFYGTTESVFGSTIVLGHGRASTIGLLLKGDALGQIRFAGGDGTDLASVGAEIRAEVDNTAGVDSMPCRLVFSTTADGAAIPTERMRIKSTGVVNIAATTVYTDNTAAKAGGLVAGDIYRKADGTLMITF